LGKVRILRGTVKEITDTIRAKRSSDSRIARVEDLELQIQAAAKILDAAVRHISQTQSKFKATTYIYQYSN
jgi:hypothetical protein